VKKIIALAIIVLSLSFLPVWGATVDTPDYSDPLSSTSTVRTGEFYSAHVLASASYVYDESGGTAATSGQVNCMMFENKSIFFNVTVAGVTSVDIIIEGRSANQSTTWGSIYTKSFTTSTTKDFVVPVVEHMDFIRVGVKYTGGAVTTDKVTITFSFRNLY